MPFNVCRSQGGRTVVPAESNLLLINLDTEHGLFEGGVPTGTQKALSLAVMNTLTAMQIIGITKLILNCNTTDATAQADSTSLIATTAMFIIGSAVGFISGAGVSLAKAMADRDTVKLSTLIQTARVISMVLGVLAMMIIVTLTRCVLPKIVSDDNTTKVTVDFLEPFSLTMIAEFLLQTHALIESVVGNQCITPVVTVGSYKLSSLAWAYFFAYKQQLGVQGVGYGCVVAAWSILLFSTVGFSRSKYRELRLWQGNSMNDYKDSLKELYGNGWRLMLQRSTEWLSLASIAFIISSWNKNLLAVIQPSLQSLTVCNLFLQGYGQSFMNSAKAEATKINSDLQSVTYTVQPTDLHIQITQMLQKQRKNFVDINAIGLIIAGIFTISMSCARDALKQQFIYTNLAKPLSDDANTIIVISACCLILDTGRINLSAWIRGNGELLLPTIVNFICILVCGVPIGIGISLVLDKNLASIFIVRGIAILIACIINLYRHNIINKQYADRLGCD